MAAVEKASSDIIYECVTEMKKIFSTTGQLAANAQQAAMNALKNPEPQLEGPASSPAGLKR